MGYVIGQSIPKLITLRDGSEVGILGLAEDDFTTLEAYSLSDFGTTAEVAVEEVDDGQYILTFEPTTDDTWALHYIYDVNPVYKEDTFEFQVSSTATITVTSAGGTWTYAGDLTDPAQLVRFLIQDTDETYPLFTDTEIAYALGAAGNLPRKAASSLIERLMARYSQMADTTELDLSVRASQLYEQAKSLLATLNNRFAGGGDIRPYAGGISNADMLSVAQNTDRRLGIFDRNNIYAWRKPTLA